MASQLAAAKGKVLNRSDVLVERDPGLKTWGPWHLEPAWMVVVAAALAHLGKAEIAYGFGRIDALSLDRIVKLPLAELTDFTHIAPSAALPTDDLTTAAELLGLPAGSIPGTGANQVLVGEFGTRATNVLDQVVEAEGMLTEGLQLWGFELIDLADERMKRVKALRGFAEDIKARNAVGKLNKLHLDSEQVALAKAGRAELRRLAVLQKAVTKLSPSVEFLREAVASFGEDDPTSIEALDLRSQIDEALQTSEIDLDRVTSLVSRAEQLRTDFVTAAHAYFRHTFLDAAGDKKKQELLNSHLWADLGKLAAITLLQGGQFTNLKGDLAEIQTIMELSEQQLQKSVVVEGRQPGRKAGPSAEARMSNISARCVELLESWRETLHDNLADPGLDEQIALLPQKQRDSIEAFRSAGAAPSPVTDEFVAAVEAVFRRFDVRTMSVSELLKYLFPGESAATPEELRDRFDEHLGAITANAPVDRVRVVLGEEAE